MSAVDSFAQPTEVTLIDVSSQIKILNKMGQLKGHGVMQVMIPMNANLAAIVTTENAFASAAHKKICLIAAIAIVALVAVALIIGLASAHPAFLLIALPVAAIVCYTDKLQKREIGHLSNAEALAAYEEASKDAKFAQFLTTNLLNKEQYTTKEMREAYDLYYRFNQHHNDEQNLPAQLMQLHHKIIGHQPDEAE